jgi:hypothetical protein
MAISRGEYIRFPHVLYSRWQYRRRESENTRFGQFLILATDLPISRWAGHRLRWNLVRYFGIIRAQSVIEKHREKYYMLHFPICESPPAENSNYRAQILTEWARILVRTTSICLEWSDRTKSMNISLPAFYIPREGFLYSQHGSCLGFYNYSYFWLYHFTLNVWK